LGEEKGGGGRECNLSRLHRLVLRNAERMLAFFPGDAKDLIKLAFFFKI